MRAKSQDDRAAWEEFVFYYKGFIHMVLGKIGLSRTDQDDLTQEVLVKIWKNLPNHIYDPKRARFRTWLSCVIRNQVSDNFRQAQRRNRKHIAIAEEQKANDSLMMTEPEIENIIKKEWEVYIVKLALNNIAALFSAGAIEAFSMSMDGKSTEEIAQHLGIKPNSVIKLKNRIKERLIKEIQHLRTELEVK